MRITILSNYDAPSALALSFLLPKLRLHNVQVFYTKKINTKRAQKLRQLAEFDLSLTANSLVFESHDSKELNQINQGDDFLAYTFTEPDLVLSVRHMSILRDSVIALPKYGVINLHSGPLPQYRGVMATFWAMRNRETKAGMTLHAINDANIDTGNIIAQSAQNIHYDKSYLWNTLNLYKNGCDLMIKAVERIDKQDTFEQTSQQGTPAYFSFPTDQDLAGLPFKLFDETDSFQAFL